MNRWPDGDEDHSRALENAEKMQETFTTVDTTSLLCVAPLAALRMSCTFVTLAEALEHRGAPLVEEELWGLLLATVERLAEISHTGDGGACNIITPGSLLLSAGGNVAFKNCTVSDEVNAFVPLETRRGCHGYSRPASEKMMVYSLGMTLYWSAAFHIPQDQPMQLSAELNRLLLSMCEETVSDRLGLDGIWEACRLCRRTPLPPPPSEVVCRLAREAFGDSVGSSTDGSVLLSDRSQAIRERLHGLHRVAAWDPKSREPLLHACHTNPDRVLPRFRHRGSDSSFISQCSRLHVPRPGDQGPGSVTLSDSTFSLARRRTESLGPEFSKMLEEPETILELPGSIVSKKGKLCSSRRNLNVIMPSGRGLSVKCDVKSRGRDVFDMVAAHANLVEHFYFGLAFLDDDEFFFLEHETKISKVAPDCWKKFPTADFILFLRVKFFVDNVGLALHKLTQHQYYLQLRKDILEDRLNCNEETCLFLGALALQADFGDYVPEVHGKSYFQPEKYVSKAVLGKMALHCLKEELLRLHVRNAQILPAEAEMEFLKVVQQLPEYGVLFYRVAPEKKPAVRELTLGICAKGLTVYEVKKNSRIPSLKFQWKETDSISATRRKITVESSISGRKHTFVTESSEIARYLLSLCSAQHKFYNETISRDLSRSRDPDESVWKWPEHMKWLSRSEAVLPHAGLSTLPTDVLSKSCEYLPSRPEARLRGQRFAREDCSSQEPISHAPSDSSLQKTDSEALSVSSASVRGETPTRASPEREILCVSLKKDQKLGLGFVIVGEDDTGKMDLGIFIASVIPGGPADKDGRIRPGGRLISLNKTSLEGVTFSTAAHILQNCPDQVELIMSQPKQTTRDSKSSLAPSTVGLATEHGFDSQADLTAERRSALEELEEVLSGIVTPKSIRRLHVPAVRILDMQEGYSRSSSISSLRPAELLFLELKKENGSLGISIAGGANGSPHRGGIYIKSLVPGGAAEQDGRLQTGDKLLEVNGNNLRGVTHEQAVECLKRTGEVVNLVLERETGETLSDLGSTPFTTTMDTLLPAEIEDQGSASYKNEKEAALEKNPGDLGFSPPSSEEYGNAVQVTGPSPRQPAVEGINGAPIKGPLCETPVLSPTQEVRLNSKDVHPGDVAPELDQLLPLSQTVEENTWAEASTSEDRKVDLDPSPCSSIGSDPDVPEAMSAAHPEPSAVMMVSAPKEEPGTDNAIRSPTAESMAGEDSAILVDEEYLTITMASERPKSPPEAPPTLAPPTPPPPLDSEPEPSYYSNEVWEGSEEDEEDPRKDVTKEFELKVTLTKSRSGSFGLAVARSRVDGCYYVQEVLAGPAKADGRLRAGDRLITVNGHDVTNVTDEVAAEILQSSPRLLRMVLGRALQNLCAPPQADSLPDIILRKTSTGQLGIKLMGGIGSELQGLYVTEVVPGSPAAEEGSIHPGDRMRYICGRCTMGMSLEDAVRAFEAAPRRVKLKVTRDDRPVASKGIWDGFLEWKKDIRLFLRKEEKSPAPLVGDNAEATPSTCGRFRRHLSVISEQENCVLQVELVKPERGGLGFSLERGVNGSALRVNEICSGGVAQQDGRLRVGDVLLEVNGIIVSGLSHSKVVDILHKAEGLVQLTVCKDVLCQTGPAHSYTHDPTPNVAFASPQDSQGKQKLYPHAPELLLPPSPLRLRHAGGSLREVEKSQENPPLMTVPDSCLPTPPSEPDPRSHTPTHLPRKTTKVALSVGAATSTTMRNLGAQEPTPLPGKHEPCEGSDAAEMQNDADEGSLQQD